MTQASSSNPHLREVVAVEGMSTRACDPAIRFDISIPARQSNEYASRPRAAVM
jgi:hypothetical protein